MSQYTDNAELKFQDISDEVWRKYEYPDGTKVIIKHPAAVAVSNKYRNFGGNGHRLVDSAGLSHYIPAGWVHLSWQVISGRKPYQF